MGSNAVPGTGPETLFTVLRSDPPATKSPRARETKVLEQRGDELKSWPYDLVAGGLAAAAAAGLTVSYFLRKRSTRPWVSMSLFLPVKNGWQLEQISMWNEPRVDRVSMVLHQAQLMRAGG
jgi:hypothetical protein